MPTEKPTSRDLIHRLAETATRQQQERYEIMDELRQRHDAELQAWLKEIGDYKDSRVREMMTDLIQVCLEERDGGANPMTLASITPQVQHVRAVASINGFDMERWLHDARMKAKSGTTPVVIVATQAPRSGAQATPIKTGRMIGIVDMTPQLERPHVRYDDDDDSGEIPPATPAPAVV